MFAEERRGAIMTYAIRQGTAVYYWPEHTKVAASVLRDYPWFASGRDGWIVFTPANGRALYDVDGYDEDEDRFSCTLRHAETWGVLV